MILGGALLAALGVIFCGYFLAKQSLTTHYNLYHLMWKAGLRDYDSGIARAGMIHDHEFRASLRGISIARFEAIFPSTFYEVRTPPRSAKPNQRFFIDDYQQSLSEDGRFNLVWLAVFEDGKLVQLEIAKA